MVIIGYFSVYLCSVIGEVVLKFKEKEIELTVLKKEIEEIKSGRLK